MAEKLHLIDKQDIADVFSGVRDYTLERNVTGEGVRQTASEYSHQSYVRLRAQEEAYLLFNYLDAEKNKKFKDFILNAKISSHVQIIGRKERSYGI